VLAVEVSRHGGPEELVVVERPEPVAAAGQVVVRNRWIGVNYVDLQHRAGQPYPVALPLVPGTEAAGTVVAVGAGADPGLAGAPVVHFGHLGGVYAELTAVPAEFVVPLADGVALDAAAAVTMNGTTAYVLTSLASRIGPGDVVVVQAAAGATGGAVVQLAAAAGAEVIAISSSATRGTLVLYGQSSGPVSPFDPGRLSGITGAGRGAGSLTVRWVAAGHYLTGQQDRADAVGAVLGQVAAGRLSPRIAGRFPLSRASEAHARLADRKVLGKILLQA
jgi:NADPH2:quinone reductase